MIMMQYFIMVINAYIFVNKNNILINNKKGLHFIN